MKYASPHWTNGGTGLTNFDSKEVDQYQHAIDTYTGPGKFWIEKAPMRGPGLPRDYSLHRSEIRDCSEFWAHLDETRKASQQ